MVALLLPAITSYAAESAAASAADWFPRFIVYQNPLSRPKPTAVINTGRAIATITMVLPCVSHSICRQLRRDRDRPSIIIATPNGVPSHVLVRRRAVVCREEIGDRRLE